MSFALFRRGVRSDTFVPGYSLMLYSRIRASGRRSPVSPLHRALMRPPGADVAIWPDEIAPHKHKPQHNEIMLDAT